jgi:ABC-type sugar transport system permease subunit
MKHKIKCTENPLIKYLWTFSNLILQSVFAQLFANVLNQKFKGRNLARTAVLLPWIIPAVSIALVIRWVLLPRIGIVNEILINIGLLSKPIEFLGAKYAMISLILLETWKYVPIGSLLVLSALQT